MNEEDLNPKLLEGDFEGPKPKGMLPIIAQALSTPKNQLENKPLYLWD